MIQKSLISLAELRIGQDFVKLNADFFQDFHKYAIHKLLRSIHSANKQISRSAIESTLSVIDIEFEIGDTG